MALNDPQNVLSRNYLLTSAPQLCCSCDITTGRLTVHMRQVIVLWASIMVRYKLCSLLFRRRQRIVVMWNRCC